MTENESAKIMRLELPADLNELLLAYKRALKRNTGKAPNKDEIILEILENHKPTIQQKLNRLNADYNKKMATVRRK